MTKTNMTAKAGGNAPTTSNIEQVRRVRTERQVIADARAQGFEIYNDSEVRHRRIGDMEPMPWSWGCVAGADLATEILQVAALNEELGFSPEECIDSCIRDALKHLGGERVNDMCRASIAVGLLHALSEVIAQSLMSGDALPIVEKLRERSALDACECDRQESEKLKAKALSRHKAKAQEVAA